MTGLLQNVRRTIRRHGLCPPGSRVLVGLSGGSDSVALTLLLRDLAERGGFTVVGLAHFNHQLRPSAARDEQFCRALAVRLNLPISVDGADVRAYAASERLSLEDAARRLRYDFLHRVATQWSADRIAVGHTQDDQAETFLMKLIRGAGLTGLGGVYPRRGNVIRPLLDVSRADLRRFLEHRAYVWVDDESNAELDNFRSRVRHKILPELDRAYGGSTRAALARTAALVREDGEWLDEVSNRRFAEIAVSLSESVQIDAARLAQEPPPVARRILLRAMRAVSGGREVSLDHVEAAMHVLTGLAGGVDLPGSRLELRGEKLVLVEQGSPLK